MIDRLMSTFSQCYFQDNAGDNQCCPFKNEDAVYLLSFAIIMLNTDLHKVASHKNEKKMTKVEFINNLRGAEGGGEMSKDLLSIIYDSIASNPIIMGEEQRDDGADGLTDIMSNVRNMDSTLRCLAVHHFKFASIDDLAEALESNPQDTVGDLSRSCISKTWNEWYGVVNTGLETAHLDPTGLEPCVEILLYALCNTIILDMPLERAAFLNQLGRLKAFEQRRYGRWVSPHDTYKDEEWYMQLEAACSGSDERKLWALRKIHRWMLSLKAALQVDVKNKVQMAEAVKEIVDGDFLLQDPARSFVRSDDLVKKSSRSGRLTDARFFLFSDVLVYTKAESDGRFRICEDMPLHLMKVVEFFKPSQKNRQLLIEIHHPRKSFQILCPSPEVRKEWVAAIKAACQLEMERKMNVEAARMAVYPAA